MSLDQEIAKNVGVFLRGMVSDGQVEVYAYMPPDRSLSFGQLAKRASWKRPFDLAGVALGLGWIAEAHGRYLGLGGVDGFIGDGKISRAADSIPGGEPLSTVSLPNADRRETSQSFIPATRQRQCAEAV